MCEAQTAREKKLNQTKFNLSSSVEILNPIEEEKKLIKWVERIYL